MTARVIAVRVQLWCACGGALDVRGTSQSAVDGVAAEFERIHTGGDHRPTNARAAATARRLHIQRERAR